MTNNKVICEIDKEQTYFLCYCAIIYILRYYLIDKPRGIYYILLLLLVLLLLYLVEFFHPIQELR